MNVLSAATLAATVLVLGAAYGPLLAEFCANLWGREHYQHFPFVLAAFVGLLGYRCARARPREASLGPEQRLSWLDTPLVGAWLVLLLAAAIHSPWLAAVSACLVVASLFRRLARRWQIEYLWGIWLLPWLIVPPPMNRDAELTGVLQRVSSRLSSGALDWVGVDHLMEGNTLLLADKPLFVDEACSGIVSVMSIIACAVIYGVWRNRPPVHLAALTAASVGWATVMNVGRISTVAVAYDRWRLDWTDGMAHELLSLAVFVITFLALVSTDWLLVGLLAPIGGRLEREVGEAPSYGRRLVTAWDRVQRWGAPAESADRGPSGQRQPPRWELAPRLALGWLSVAAFGALGAAQLVISAGPAATEVARLDHRLERALALEADALPARVAGLDRVGFRHEERPRDDAFGQYSQVYEYRDAPGNLFLVSFDFPFDRWHELTVCYRGIGWELVGRRVFDAAVSSQQPWNYAEARFTRPDGTAALLVYAVFDVHGAPVVPPEYSLADDLWRTLRRQSRWDQAQGVYQVQVLTTAAGATSDNQRARATELLLDVRERFRTLVTSPTNQPAPSDGHR